MSLKYRDSQGTETPVAGLNGTSGELVPSVALQQSGTVNFSCAENSWNTVDVTFTTPMPDTDYLVNTDSGETAYVHVQVATTKRTTGFTMIVWNRDAVSNTGIIRWTAFKLMTDTVHEADAAHIAQNTANFAPAFSEVTSYAVGDYVTYNNVLYRCTTAHTAGVWVAGHFTAVTVGGDLSAIVPSDASASNKLVSNNTLNGWKGVNAVSSAYKLTRTAVKGGCALFSDVFGNTYIVSSGDQSSRFSVRQINAVGNTDTSKYWTGNEVCYISASVFSLTLIAVFGSLNYEAIPSPISTAPTGTTEFDIQTSVSIGTVTSGSTAPVTSGGVYSSIQKYSPYISDISDYFMHYASTKWLSESTKALLKAYKSDGSLLWGGILQWTGSANGYITNRLHTKYAGSGSIEATNEGGSIAFNEVPSLVEAYYIGEHD